MLIQLSMSVGQDTVLMPDAAAALQGATDAHEFFVLESGSCDVFVTRPGDITAKKVKTYGPGSAFGELALLYAAPRAATVSEGFGTYTNASHRTDGLQRVSFHQQGGRQVVHVVSPFQCLFSAYKAWRCACAVFRVASSSHAS